MATKDIKLEPNKVYHIFNHAVHNCNLFETEENFKSVLIEYVQHNKLQLEYKTEMQNQENIIS